MTLKNCGPFLMFHPVTKVCDWPSIVQNIRPMCASSSLEQPPRPTLSKIEPVPDTDLDIPEVPLFDVPKQPAKPVDIPKPDIPFERPIVVHNEPIDIEPVLVPIDVPIDPPLVPVGPVDPPPILGPEQPIGPVFAIPEQFNPIPAVPPNLPPPIRVPLPPPIRGK